MSRSVFSDTKRDIASVIDHLEGVDHLCRVIYAKYKDTHPDWAERFIDLATASEIAKGMATSMREELFTL